MNEYRRVAFLPDTFHEVNGVAHTSRQLEAFAKRQNIPFLSVHAGPSTEISQEGAVRVFQLKRSFASFPLDTMLDYDPLLLRYAGRLVRELKQFGAEVIHVTGPGDLGTLGLYASWRLNIPLAISWHTSLHEYAGQRLERLLHFSGSAVSKRMGGLAEWGSLRILQWFYRRAKVVLAPNEELVRVVGKLSGRPAYLMQRGVEVDVFRPERRRRTTHKFRIGYVGRLTTEKNVRFLADLGRALVDLGRDNFEIVIVGQGKDERWLREHVPHVVLTGVLRGEPLAREYANMDLFVFPSKTDTFGNVILEALASGVPAVVTSSGGPKFLVQPGVTGYVAEDDDDFVRCVNRLMMDCDLHQRMSLAARQYACAQSWDEVFERVFRAYRDCASRTKSVNETAPVKIGA